MHWTSLGATKVLENGQDTHSKTMHHAHFLGFGLGNARQTCLMLVIQCRSYQHWYLQPAAPAKSEK